MIGGQPQSAYYTGGYIHDNLTWSRTHTYNFGMELRAFQGKLGIEFDWFYKLTSRILESDSGGTYAPSLGGNNPAWLNSGRVDNRGFELTLRHANSFPQRLELRPDGQPLVGPQTASSRAASPTTTPPTGPSSANRSARSTDSRRSDSPDAGAGRQLPHGPLGLGRTGRDHVQGHRRRRQDRPRHDYVKIGRSTTPEMSFSLNMDGRVEEHLALGAVAGCRPVRLPALGPLRQRTHRQHDVHPPNTRSSATRPTTSWRTPGVGPHQCRVPASARDHQLEQTPTPRRGGSATAPTCV